MNLMAQATASPFAGHVPADGVGKQPFCREQAKYCYVLVREDLSLEQQTVQAIHAAMAATAEHGGLTPATRLALVSVKDRSHLLAMAGKLEQAGARFSLFEEPDHGIGFSALATAPGFHKDFRLLHRLPLWKRPGVALRND